MLTMWGPQTMIEIFLKVKYIKTIVGASAGVMSEQFTSIKML